MESEEERLKLKPTNIKNMNEWRKFVKAKTNVEFKIKFNTSTANHSYAHLYQYDNFNIFLYFQQKSEKYLALRNTQLPHTTGRKEMANMTEDLVR